MEKYNGWTNYATWRVNLEIFDNMSAHDFSSFDLEKYDNEYEHAYELEDELREYVTEVLENEGSGLVLDYAMAFLDDVNFKEIAISMVRDALMDEETSC